MNERMKAFCRLVVALIPVANLILINLGKSPLPFTEDEVNAGITSIIAVCGVLWAWWKNNNVTEHAILNAERDKLFDEVSEDD